MIDTWSLAFTLKVISGGIPEAVTCAHSIRRIHCKSIVTIAQSD